MAMLIQLFSVPRVSRDQHVYEHGEDYNFVVVSFVAFLVKKTSKTP